MNKLNIKSIVKPAGYLIPALLIAANASAQQTSTIQQTKSLPEIIVTADFRTGELQTIPSSLTVMTEELIKARSAQHLEDIINLAPNVNFSSGSSRARFFQIRGIGERSQFTQPINSSVGFIIDEVDFSGAATIATLFDVEQVEVLRGPQGTRYGANALAGLINIRTKAPVDETEVRLEATIADYDSYSMGVVANTSLVESKLLGRIAIHQYQSDGFIENDFLDRDDTNDRDELTVRARLRWLPSDDLTIDMSVMYIDVDNGYDAFSLDNNRKTLSDEPGTDSQRTSAVSFDVDYNLSDVADIEAVVSYSETEIEYGYDEDWTYVGIIGCQPDYSFCEYSYVDQYLRDRDNYSVDVRLVSDQSGKIFSGSTDWVVGLYYSSQDESLVRNYTPDPRFDSEYDTTNAAIYGQLDTSLNDRLTLITGIRFEQWNADYSNNNGLKSDHDEFLVGGKIGLDYQVKDSQMTYITLSKGYKAGGVNSNGNLPDDLRDFDTEYLWNLEAGLKSHWLDNSLNTRLSAFFTERKDLQVKGSIVVTAPGMGPEFIEYYENAASGENYGLEAEFDWQFTEKIELFGSLGLLYTELNDYITEDGEDMSGRDQAHAPNYQFSLGTQYAISDQWFARLEIEGKDDFYFSDAHNDKSSSYELVHARIGFEAKNWSATLWGRNLTDENYHTRGFGFANDPRDNYSTSGYTQLGEPRMIGLSFSYDM